MDSKCFYHKRKTYPNANNDIELSDESTFGDSDDDPDYFQTRPADTSAFQEDIASSECSSDDDADVPPPDSETRIPVWRNVQSGSVFDNQSSI